MDDLKQIISTFSTDEQKEFASFIQRQKKIKNRKDLELFRLLAQKQVYKPAQLLAKLYPTDQNQVAYHAVRKRLMQHLIDFILLKSSGKQAATTLGVISLALFDRKLEKLGWEFLRKAEKVALSHEQYDLLNAIYNLQISLSNSEFADKLEEIIEKHKQNKMLADQEEKANIANQLIQKKLKEIRLQGKDLDFKAVIKQILQTYQLSETIVKRPSLLYKLMTIARSEVLVSKDFYRFEPYLIEQYQFVVEKYGFTPQHAHYQLGLLYMIAHVLYRNKKFAQSMLYLEKMRELFTADSHLQTQFYTKYALLLSANYALSKQTVEAIRLLETMLKERKNTLSQEDTLNIYLNLSIYYFQEENYKKANQCFLALQSSETWLVRKMGREWVLKKNLVELIAQYELKNYDLARNKLKSVEKNFADMLAQSLFQNVKAYLYFIRQMLDNPSIRPDRLFAQTDELFAFDPIAEEDLQEIRFYAWLKAKLLKKKYQEVLEELVSRVSSD
ncbi:hypothetical protein [Thermoflexibacter ruber]|uniref:Tetratricopeptide repeat-containing protein n=1 Tax=Thermoflexibacter ruber TaxID=1003 RepID=A0A1I2HSZ3_9BACT|nr:hypothetical protein [Thermoflexibacter ruber]SFF31521.1 hypothetical protein SAMN04488541_102537 [Thermoflexibacter ruber]